MTRRIKICGITRLEDACIAAELGAWALGFIFYNKSPRYICPENAAEIINSVKKIFGARVYYVGVFVNENLQTIKEVKKALGLDYVQLHGDEPDEFLDLLETVWKVVRLSEDSDEELLRKYSSKAQNVVLETPCDVLYGGTGKIGNWNLASLLNAKYDNLILSGGINPNNIAKAIKQVRPYAIDLSSGVELSPGVKDHQLLKDLFKEVKDVSVS